MSASQGSTQTAFVEVRSFVPTESELAQEHLNVTPPSHPFVSLYELEGEAGLPYPDAEEYVTFLNELYDEDFNEALFELANEAATIHQEQFIYEQEGPEAFGLEAERILDQHFAPLGREIEAMLEALATEFTQRDASSITEGEIEASVDRYRRSVELSPTFEDFFKKIGRFVKKVAKKAVGLAKKGISFVGKFALGPILKKLKALIKPLLKRVLRFAIGKLPPSLQPVAKKLAERLPFLKELEEEAVEESETDALPSVAQLQLEFNQQVTDLLFAGSEVEQDLEVARAISDSQAPESSALAALDWARNEFIDRLSQLKEGEDPTPHLENFIPAILPVLRQAIRMIGRKRVVYFLARLLAKLIQRFIGPQFAPALSRAIVDAGMRLVSLEATAQDEARAAGEAVAEIVEDTVRRVTALPEYVLENDELLEGFALEAFEQAAAANLPPVLTEEVYRNRPELREARIIRGTWLLKPLRGRKRYKKFSRVQRTKITPHKALKVESFGGVPLGQVLEEQFGLSPGAEVEAEVHIYEAIPGTMLPQMARLEKDTPGLGTAAAHAYAQLHPLTPDAAELLLGEHGLGREVDARYVEHPHTTAVGQRFYYLAIPGARGLTTPDMRGQTKMRRPSGVWLTLDFPANLIRVYLFLSELRAQGLAVTLRQRTHISPVTALLRRHLERGLRAAFTSGGFGRLKVIHEAVPPERLLGSVLRRLPSLVPGRISQKVQEWALRGITDFLKQQTQQVITATESPADGITFVITIGNPPGLTFLRDALKGKVASLASLRLSDGAPDVTVRVVAGYTNG